MSTWARTVLARLEWMRTVDRNRHEFGASSHGYQLAPPILEDSLLAIERENGYRFPGTLRDFWEHAGAGGAGPDYGVLGPREVRPFRPTEQVTPIDELRRFGLIRMALWDTPATVDQRSMSAQPVRLVSSLS